tara:strand:+ start:116 stop:658 length:543 start_codon:yes stop_codon:yes gene_type:complete
MRIIETKAYQFQELDEQTKEKAIDNYRYVSVEHDSWWDFVKEDLISVGIELRSFDIDRGSFAEIHLEDFYETCELILKWHGENCETYKIAERYIKEHDSIKEKMDNLECNENDDSDEEHLNKLMQLDKDLEDLDEEYQKEFSWEVLSMLRKEYEYMISDEHTIEIFEVNEYEFTKEGKLI